MNNKGIINLFVVIGAVALIALGIFLFLKGPSIFQKDQSTAQKMDIEEDNVVITSEEASDNEKDYEVGGSNPEQSYKIKVLPNWKVDRVKTYQSEEFYNEDLVITYTLDEDYKLLIHQADQSGCKCLYPGDEKTDQLSVCEFTEFEDLTDVEGNKFRRSFDKETARYSQNAYEVCEYNTNREEGAGYYSPSEKYGRITYVVPLDIYDENSTNNINAEIIKLMDEMVKSMQR
jgi:hypothetical protein